MSSTKTKGFRHVAVPVTYGPDLRPRMNHRRDAVSATWEGAASFSYPARGPYFGRYIRIVGRQVHPALSVTAEAEVVVDDMLHHIFHQLAKEIKAMGRAGTHLHASDPGASDPGAPAAPSEDEAAPLATRRCSSGTKEEARASRTGEYVLRQVPSSRMLHEDTPRFKWVQDTAKGAEGKEEGGEGKAASGASGASGGVVVGAVGGEAADVVAAGDTTNETNEMKDARHIGGHGMYRPDQVTARHVSLAVRLVCVGELAKHALSEGTKAIRNLQASWCAKSGEVTFRHVRRLKYEGPDDALLKLCMSEEAPDMSKVRALIDAGIDLRFKDETDKTALFQASAQGYTDIVRVLLEADSSAEHIQAFNNGGYTALHIASENDHTDTVKALLEADPSVEHIRKVTQGKSLYFGNTALILASHEGNRDIVEAILEADPSVEHIRMSNKEGSTAFSLASTNAMEGTCHDNKNADEIKALFCRAELNWGFDMSWDTLREQYFECRRNRSSSMTAGLQFPVMVCGDMLTSFTGRPCSLQAAVFLAAVLEYHAAEILELAGNAANDLKSSSIVTRHIALATRGDRELDNTFQGTIMRGGVIPHVRKAFRTPELPFSSNGVDYVDNADGCVY